MTMIERMARAIFCERTANPDYDFDADSDGWDRDMYRAFALAALHAMREPTMAMAIAGNKTTLYPSRTFAAMIDVAIGQNMIETGEVKSGWYRGPTVTVEKI